MKTLVYTESGNFATIMADGVIGEVTIPELKNDTLSMHEIEEYFGKKFPELELVNVGFKVCNDNFRDRLDFNHFEIPPQAMDHFNMHFVSVSKMKDIICDSYGKTGMFGSGHVMFKKLTDIKIDIETYISKKDHNKKMNELQDRIKDLEDNIKGALKCRDLWGVPDNAAIEYEHTGEYQMLSAMESEFKRLVNKK